MTLRKILHYPDSRLREVSADVSDFNQDLQKLVEDMFETMRHSEGIGLAAIQIGVPLRLAVIEVDEPWVVVNPKLEVLDATLNAYEEGCLSLPGIRCEIQRPTSVKLCAFNQLGKPFEQEVDGLLSVCLQHEIDHMDGKLLIDKLSPLKRSPINNELRNLIALHQNSAIR